MKSPKILFVLKKREIYDQATKKMLQSGLFNSAKFANDMLNQNGIESHLVQVIDNNCIDREVTKYKPTHVIIEAIWVVPEKFDVLHKLHPHVKWIVRLHSEIPFIANEGNAIDWILKYSEIGSRNHISIAPNTIKMYNDLKSIGVKHLIYLSNYYPVTIKHWDRKYHRNHINIGCFGAIRPMKNQLIQALAAIQFGNTIDKEIHFHINADRVERGDNALRNIRALFEKQTRHKLIEHPWYHHSEFTELISKMDIGLQVSFNETFNIVAADFVVRNIPLVGSDEINWLHCLYKANPTSTASIVNKLKTAYYFKDYNLQQLNKNNLFDVIKEAEKIWCNYFKNH